MSIQLSSNFLESAQQPLDARTVVLNATARDAIPAIQRYEGLSVYLTATKETWQLQGGITNADWVSIGTSTGVWDRDISGPAFLKPHTPGDNVNIGLGEYIFGTTIMLPYSSSLDDGILMHNAYSATTSAITPVAFLNDFSVTGGYAGTVPNTITVSIDSISPANGFLFDTYGVTDTVHGPITGGNPCNVTFTSLAGLTLANLLGKFGHLTGHHVGDQWTFTETVSHILSLTGSAGSVKFQMDNDGKLALSHYGGGGTQMVTVDNNGLLGVGVVPVTGANTALSNLVATDINADLMFQVGRNATLQTKDQTTADTAGDAMVLGAGNGLGNGKGGECDFYAGGGGQTGDGGDIYFNAGSAGVTSGNGGNVNFYGGNGSGGGSDGKIIFTDPTSGISAKFNTSLLATADKTFTFPNHSITFDNINTSTTTNGTGFLKGNGSVISFDNSTYLSGVTADSPLSGAGTAGSHLVVADNASGSKGVVAASGTPATNVYWQGAITTGATSWQQILYADISGTPNLGNYLAAAGGTVGSGSQAQAFTLGIKIAQIGGTAGKYTLIQGGAQTGDITYTLPVAAPVTLSGNLRSTTAGILSWDETVYLSSVTAHNLLSATHGDTLTDTVVRGDVMVGNVTPKWSRLAFPGTPTGKVLVATATDVAWSTNALGTAAWAATGDFLALHGKADTAGNADTVTTNANLTGVVTSVGNATSIASGAIKANMLQAATTDLGAANVTIDLSNSNGSYVTNLTTDGIITSGGLALGLGSITMTGSIADTTNRVTKGWFTNLEITNLPTINGGTLATALSLSGINSGDQNVLYSIVVSGQTTVTAASTTQALTLVAGTGVTITTDNTAKSVTLNASATPAVPALEEDINGDLQPITGTPSDDEFELDVNSDIQPKVWDYSDMGGNVMVGTTPWDLDGIPQVIQINISSAQILSGAGAIIPAIGGGGGKIPIVTNIVWSFTYGGTAYAGGGSDMWTLVESGTLTQITPITVVAGASVGLSGTQTDGTTNIILPTPVCNTGTAGGQVRNAGAGVSIRIPYTFTTGNGTMKVFITYYWVTI